MESLIAIVETGPNGAVLVLAPKLGYFVPEVEAGAVVSGGRRIGHLKILNQRLAVLLPPDSAGRVQTAILRPGAGVEYRGRLLELASLDVSVVDAHAQSPSAKTEDGELIRAPIHGIFYTRPSPGAAPFIEVGQPMKRGQTVGLIEVMKTFNPVVFDGPNLPESAALVETLAKDQAEVEAGQPLLRWRAD